MVKIAKTAKDYQVLSQNFKWNHGNSFYSSLPLILNIHCEFKKNLKVVLSYKKMLC